jgi:hypothetical protein
MSTYGQTFYHRHLIEAESFSPDQMIDGGAQVLLHSTIPVNPKKIDPGATIRLPLPAGDTLPAPHIGNDHYRVTDRQIVRILTDSDNLSGQFVAKDSRIRKIGLLSLTGMKICSTDADSPDPDQGFPWLGMRGIDLLHDELAGTLTNDRFHWLLLYRQMSSPSPFPLPPETVS